MKTVKRVRILYAEDDEDADLRLSTLLGFAGIEVSPARSVKDACDSAQTEHFDEYLLENRFYDGTGLELCRRLNEFNPQTPIVFYSADACQSDRQKGLAAGAKAYKAYVVKSDINTVARIILKLTSKQILIKLDIISIKLKVFKSSMSK